MIGGVRAVSKRMLSSGKRVIALLFPGQGSQSVGMLRGKGGADDLTRIPAAATLLEHVDPELLQVIDRGPRHRLALTQWTQPAVYVAALCHYERWRHQRLPAGGEEGEKGALPPTQLVMLGHSVGEYAALCAAGLISFQQGLELVVGRRVPAYGACQST